MSSFGIAFAPHLPLWQLAAFRRHCAASSSPIRSYRRAHGAWARLLAFAVILVALANPLIVKETRQGLSNIVALIIDRSQSMEIGSRKADSEKALAALRDKLKTHECRAARRRSPHQRRCGRCRRHGAVLGAERGAVRCAARSRRGRDRHHRRRRCMTRPIPRPSTSARRSMCCSTGAPNERDRKLTVVRATRFNIVGKNAQITFRIDDFGGAPAANAQLSLRIDGQDAGQAHVSRSARTPPSPFPSPMAARTSSSWKPRPGRRSRRFRTTARRSSSMACATVCAFCWCRANRMPASASGAIC